MIRDRTTRDLTQFEPEQPETRNDLKSDNQNPTRFEPERPETRDGPEIK
jgi:hypothetical protein